MRKSVVGVIVKKIIIVVEAMFKPCSSELRGSVGEYADVPYLGSLGAPLCDVRYVDLVCMNQRCIPRSRGRSRLTALMER